MEDRPSDASRRRLLPFAFVAAALTLAAVIATVLLWTDDKPATTTTGARESAPVVSLAGHGVCADQIIISVMSDAEMNHVADVVRRDPRARKLYTETKADAFHRFQRIFQDNPDLLKAARPEALPASVTITATGNTDLRAWAAELTAAFPAADSVRPVIMSEALPSLTARYGTAAAIPPCPASGERN